MPLLIWWGLEAKAESDREAVLGVFADPAVWQLPLVRQHLLGRLMRRYAATGARKDLLTCAKLLEQAPHDDARKALMVGFEEAYQGRSLAGLPVEWIRKIMHDNPLAFYSQTPKFKPQLDLPYIDPATYQR